jgi:hypothetical protein
MRLALALVAAVALWACGSNGPSSTQGSGQTSSGRGNPTTAPTYDLDALGTPKFVTTNYIDLSSIARVSRFRSSAGHDYHDDVETCRSMKHYFEPKSSANWSSVAIFSPVQGTVDLTRDDIAGLQIVIRSQTFPAFTFIIFHVNPTTSVTAGTALAQGQPLGTHIGSQTMSDIAVGVQTPGGYRLVSWFDVMTDGLFQAYAARGIASRGDAVIGRAARDADPLSCSGETFLTLGSLSTWLVLN